MKVIDAGGVWQAVFEVGVHLEATMHFDAIHHDKAIVDVLGPACDNFRLVGQVLELSAVEGDCEVKVGDEGVRFAKELDDNLNDYHARYSSFGSVSIEPPALGVEQGFDVSLQIMELDGIEIIEALIHKVLDSRRDELFDCLTWQDNYLQRQGLEEIYSALAYKTHFSLETLNALREIS